MPPGPRRGRFADRAREHRQRAGLATLETNVALLNGIRLTGTVSGVRGSALLGVGYSRLRADTRMTAWVRLLALSAAHPGVPYGAITIGRTAEKDGGRRAATRGDRPARPACDTPAGRREVALEELAKLVALRDEGLREPLPLPSRAGAAYAQAISRRRRRQRGRRPESGPPAGPASFYLSMEDEQPGEPDRVRRHAASRRATRPLRSGAVGAAAVPRNGGGAVSEPTQFQLTSELPLRGDGAGGERRHRQDLHDRGARNTIHRGGGEPRRDAAGDLHAARYRRAARARPRPARLNRAGAGGRARGARPGGPRRRDRGAVAGR